MRQGSFGCSVFYVASVPPLQERNLQLLPAKRRNRVHQLAAALFFVAIPHVRFMSHAMWYFYSINNREESYECI